MKTITKKQLIKKRVRAKIYGTPDCPRLAVFVSNSHVSAQLIDDTRSVTLGYATSVGKKDLVGKTMTQKASWVGQQIAAAATKKKLKEVVFDRGSKIYHGRIAVLAEAARQGGLKF